MWQQTIHQLQSNQISALFIGNEHISKKEAKAISAALQKNTSLVSIEVYNIDIKEDDLSNILFCLKDHPNLESLIFEHLKINDDAMENIVQCLASTPKLKSIQLSNNSLSSIAIETLTNALHHNTSLLRLEISDQKHLEPHSIHAISNCLRFNRSLHTLSLKDNQLGNKWVQILAEGLKINTSLQTLDLSNNHLEFLGISAIASMIKVNPHLNAIYLGQNNIDDKACSELLDALLINTNIKTLNLQSNELSPLGIQMIARHLESSNLQHLDLSFNPIDEASANEFAKALEGNHYLQSINLCNVGQVGIKVIVKTLEKNSSITHINLSSNLLKVSDIDAIAEMLYVNTSLLSLNLSGNPYPSSANQPQQHDLVEFFQHHIQMLDNQRTVHSSYQKLFSALSVNSILESIYLSGNQLRYTEAIAVAKMIASNQSLKVIDLRGNAINDLGILEIARSLAHNQSLKSLNIASNSFTENASKATLAALKINLSLEECIMDSRPENYQLILNELFMNQINNDRELTLSISELECHLEQIKINYPGELPLKVKQFREKLQLKLAEELWKSCPDDMTSKEIILKILNILQYQPLNQEARQLTQLCIAKLHGIQLDTRQLLSSHLLRETAKKLQESLPICALKDLLIVLTAEPNYHPIKTGSLVAIPILMGYLDCQPWLEANANACQLIDTFMNEELQAPILHTQIINEDNALNILQEYQRLPNVPMASHGLFFNQEAPIAAERNSLKRKWHLK